MDLLFAILFPLYFVLQTLLGIVALAITLGIGYVIVDYIKRSPVLDMIINRHVLVTGCDSGFGNLLARKLDQIGCPVFAACLTEDGANKLKEETSDRLKTVIMNVGDLESVRRAYKEVAEALPADQGLWGIVNNAGVMGKSGPTEFHTSEDFHDCLKVNLYGMIDVTNTFLPLIKKSKGRIVNTTSISGRVAHSTITIYSVSKWAGECYSDCIRRTLGPFGVNVAIIEPGGFGTPINDKERFERQWWDLYNKLDENVKEDYGEEFIKQHIENSTRYTGRVSSNVEAVVDVYKHALFAASPRTRYSVGNRARFFAIPLSYMPSWIQDHVQEGRAPLPAKGKRQTE